jgi:xanthine/uracil permease
VPTVRLDTFAGMFFCSVIKLTVSFFLIVMGVFSKFAAALVAIPAPVLGGMTSKF